MRRLFRGLLLLAGLVPAGAHADVVLNGSQHIGDCQDTLLQCTGFTPLDPQSRNDMFNTLIKFNLTTTTTITALRLDGAVWPDRQQLQVYVQLLGGTNTLRAGTLNTTNSTFTFSPSLVLLPGTYSLWLDGGCSTASGGSHFYANCGNSGNDNDFGFSSITLVSAQTSTSRMLNRRRHIGDDTEADLADDDGDYDGAWYPDAAEGTGTSPTFTIDANRRLTGISVFSMRDIDSGSPATVSINGVQVGTLNAESTHLSPLVISTSVLLLTGSTHTVAVQTAAAGDRDDISWDDIILTFADTVAGGTPGLFNAVNTGASGVSGVLSTKVAGGSPGIDIVALNTLGTAINTGYTGTVTVQLLDASVDGAVDPFTGCHATWTAVAGYSTSVTFVAANAGRVALPAPFFSTTLTKAALRMTDTTTGAAACSTDRFALRPDHFAVAAYQGSETTPGANPLNNTAATSLPRHKAGQPFRIEAVAVDASNVPLGGYAGTLDTSHTTTAIAPAVVDGTVTTGSWIASGATRTTDEARYDEVGAFTLVLKDSTFANVDAGDSTDAQRWITGTADIGRFIPDHFTFTETQAEFAPACGTAFTYAGQPFGYALVPTGRITAMTGHSTPAITRNYTSGALHKITAMGAPTFTDLSGTLTEVSAPAAPTLAAIGNGVTEVTLAGASLRFPRGAPAAPFDADIAITLGALSEGDGVGFLTTPVRFGDASAGNGVDFTAGANSVRFGRLVVDNAHGPEQHPLRMPFRVEYWNNGFGASADDACTALVAADFAINTALSLVTPPTIEAGPPGDGIWTLRLTQNPPQVPGSATVQAVLGTNFPWLQTDDTDADTSYDDDPIGLATFGLSNDQDRRIFQREVINQ